jgi:hypothetical protein
MSNMSYCRFENTLEDLRDCLDHIEDEVGSKDEHEARKELIEVCQEIIKITKGQDLKFEGMCPECEDDCAGEVCGTCDLCEDCCVCEQEEEVDEDGYLTDEEEDDEEEGE